MQFFLILAAVIAVAFIVLTVQNPSTVITLDFIKWTISGPPALMLSVPFVAGILAGIFMLIPSLWKKSSQTRSSRKQVHELEAEVSRLIAQKTVSGQDKT